MPETESKIELFALLDALRRRGGQILAITVAVFAVAAVATLKIPKLYRAQALVRVENVAAEEAALGAVLPRSMTQVSGGEDRSRMPTEEYAMTTPPVIDSLIQKLQIRNSKGQLRQTIRTSGTWVPLVPFPDMSVKCAASENTSVIRVRGYARTPELAMAMANTLVDCYLADKVQGQRTQLRTALSFLDGQTAELFDTFAGKRRALQAYQEEHGTVDPDRETQAAIDRLMQLREMEQQCSLSLRTAETSLQPLYQELTKVLSAQMLDQLVSPSVSGLQARLEQLEANRNDPHQSPAAQQQTQQDIHAVQDQLREAILPSSRMPEEVTQSASQDLLRRYLDGRVQVISLTAQHEAIEKLIAEQRSELRSIPQEVSSLLPLEINSDAAAETYRTALQQRGSLTVGAAVQASDVRLISYAKLPSKPNLPIVPINLAVGLLAGLGLGVFVALIREFNDDSIRTPESLQKAIPVPLLATVAPPRRREDGASFRADPRSSHVRSYRSMRNALWNGRGDRKCRTAAVVSAQPREGRTSVCVGLAQSSASEYGRVLIVDVDLQRPGLHKRFNFSPLPGLTDHLFRGAALDECIRPTEVPGLSILPAGTVANDTGAVFKSGEFRELMTRLRSQYDYIIFDTPPTLVVNDVVLLKDWVDNAIVLAHIGKTRQRDLDALLDVLQAAGLEPSHSVLIGGPRA